MHGGRSESRGVEFRFTPFGQLSNELIGLICVLLDIKSIVQLLSACRFLLGIRGEDFIWQRFFPGQKLAEGQTFYQAVKGELSGGISLLKIRRMQMPSVYSPILEKKAEWGILRDNVEFAMRIIEYEAISLQYLEGFSERVMTIPSVMIPALRSKFLAWKYIPKRVRSLDIALQGLEGDGPDTAIISTSIAECLDKDEWDEYLQSKEFILKAITRDLQLHPSIMWCMPKEHFADEGFIRSIILKGISCYSVKCSAEKFGMLTPGLEKVIADAGEEYARITRERAMVARVGGQL